MIIILQFSDSLQDWKFLFSLKVLLITRQFHYYWNKSFRFRYIRVSKHNTLNNRRRKQPTQILKEVVTGVLRIVQIAHCRWNVHGLRVGVRSDLVLVRMVVGLHWNASGIMLGVRVRRIDDGLGVDVLPGVTDIARVSVRRRWLVNCWVLVSYYMGGGWVGKSVCCLLRYLLVCDLLRRRRVVLMVDGDVLVAMPHPVRVAIPLIRRRQTLLAAWIRVVHSLSVDLWRLINNIVGVVCLVGSLVVATSFLQVQLIVETVD